MRLNAYEINRETLPVPGAGLSAPAAWLCSRTGQMRDNRDHAED
jgi:hypothetical protein